jgi:hypothetical protein
MHYSNQQHFQQEHPNLMHSLARVKLLEAMFQLSHPIDLIHNVFHILLVVVWMPLSYQKYYQTKAPGLDHQKVVVVVVVVVVVAVAAAMVMVIVVAAMAMAMVMVMVFVAMVIVFMDSGISVLVVGFQQKLLLSIEKKDRGRNKYA